MLHIDGCVCTQIHLQTHTSLVFLYIVQYPCIDTHTDTHTHSYTQRHTYKHMYTHECAHKYTTYIHTIHTHYTHTIHQFLMIFLIIVLSHAMCKNTQTVHTQTTLITHTTHIQAINIYSYTNIYTDTHTHTYILINMLVCTNRYAGQLLYSAIWFHY